MEKGVGRCYLCSSQRELEESHIWPRFAYKEYVASQETGGRFTDLQSLSRHNRQLKKSWMCRSCEQLLNKFETPTAAFLRRINPNSDGPFAYGRYLLPFSVSLSWRVANYYVPQATKGPDTVRGPDVTFISYSKLPREADLDDYVETPPDAVFEVQSASDRWSEVLRKVAEYLKFGVSAVYVFDSEAVRIHCYFPDAPEQILTTADDFVGVGLLSGFRVPVAKFFE
jgi:Putative restriction endonuclease